MIRKNQIFKKSILINCFNEKIINFRKIFTSWENIMKVNYEYFQYIYFIKPDWFY